MTFSFNLIEAGVLEAAQHPGDQEFQQAVFPTRFSLERPAAVLCYRHSKRCSLLFSNSLGIWREGYFCFNNLITG